MPHRLEQIESSLQRVLAEALRRELSDPRLEGALVSVTRVQLSPDLHHAQVYVTVLPEQRQQRAIAALRHAAGHLRILMRKRVAMRQTPQLDFRLDESLKRQAAVYGAIREGVDRSGPEDEPAEHAEQAEEAEPRISNIDH